ncbi:flagellar hook-associated protein 2 [Virgibacillus sp. W0181]|uniref:flagellar hook-associated protein 2 n=1 Tax=Virgibacillus sp. W0181 TaxID=3391581 RepID=UPI003F465099
MVMRVGGLATGMDIESMVNKLMEAERMPLDRMEEKRTMLTWKRDAFREVNRSVLDLERMMSDMKMSYTYNPKKVTSSQENAVVATGNTSTANGMYEINVTQLATSAINVSTEPPAIDDANALLDSTMHGTYSFQTFDKDGSGQPHSFEIKEGDTLNQVLKRITKEDNNVRAFYDAQTEQVVLETTRTGSYNENGKEIVFDSDPNSQNYNSFFTEVLKLDTAKETGGQNAKFTYNNGLDIETQNNSYELNGINMQFHNETTGNARLTVTTDVETSFETVMAFVDKYNEVIDKMNKSQTEEIHRDFKPLTDEQKEEMSEDQIKKWEEKAKSGLLRGEAVISNSMYAMRRSWYSQVDTGGDITSINHIGITTSKNYLDGGKLVVDEKQLKDALRDKPNEVYKLFSNRATDSSEGLVNRLDKEIKATKDNIEKRAGKSTHTLDNYTLGKRMKELNERIFDFEARMVRVENRYWNQFTQMEKTIQRLNDQSAQLFSQFGGGGM